VRETRTGSSTPGGDDPGVLHLVQDDRGAGGGAFAFGDRGVAGGGLQQAGQKRGLPNRQVLGALVEIALRRRLDAIGAGAEIDAVQIEGEDLLLGELHLQPDGQHQLLHLAAHVLVGGQEQVLGQLLGQGRAALNDPPGAHVRHHGPAHADRIEAGVIVEAAILDGDEGGRHIVRQGGQISWRGLLRTARGDQDAVAVQIGDRRLAIDIIEGRGVRQAARKDREEDDEEDQPPHREHGAPVEQPLQSRARRFGRAACIPVSVTRTGHRHPQKSRPLQAGVKLYQNAVQVNGA
jgi:hypothetical protein